MDRWKCKNSRNSIHFYFGLTPNLPLIWQQTLPWSGARNYCDLSPGLTLSSTRNYCDLVPELTLSSTRIYYDISPEFTVICDQNLPCLAPEFRVPAWIRPTVWQTHPPRTRECKASKLSSEMITENKTKKIKPGGLDVETNRDRDRDRP